MIDQKSKNAILWTTIERFSVQGMQFVLGIIIARILLPEDYGLVAMLNIFTAIAQSLIDSGFSNALIQKKDRNQIDYSTVFFFNIFIGAVCYILIFVFSNYIASFYNEPQLVSIARVVGLNFLITSFSMVQRTKMIIEMKFDIIAKITLFSTLLSGGVALYLSLAGFGVWTLVFQLLINNAIMTILLHIFSRWCPSMLFSLESFNNLFSFGSKLLIGGLIHTIYTNLYSLVIGKKYLATDLGIFNRSFSFANVISGNVTSVMERTFYPIGCQMQNDDTELKLYFIKSIRLSSFVLFPLMFLLSVLSKPLILLLLSDKWIEVSSLLPIMCYAYMWDVIMRLNWNLLNIKGRTDYSLKSEILKKIASIAILIITIPFGLKIMCLGLILYSFADLVIVTRFTKKLLNLTLYEEVKSVFPFFTYSLLMTVVVYIFCILIDNPFAQLFVGGTLGLLIYSGSLYLNSIPEILSIVNYFKNRV